MEQIINYFNNSDAQFLNHIVICPMCQCENTIRIDREGAIKYSEGALIQNAFPNLTESERELLLTGICDTCWDLTMKDLDDDD